MKNSSFKPVLLLMCVLSFAMCENPVVNREYYDSGVVKVEERLNKEGEVVKRRGFYEDGHLGDSYRLESIMASDYLEKPFVVGVGVRGIDR